MTKTNSAGTTFRAIPMKDHPPFGEQWVSLTFSNGAIEEIGRHTNSFENVEAAERWIDEHMEEPKYSGIAT